MISLPPSTDRLIRRWPTERSRQWLASFLEGVRRDRNVVAVVAVGSAIRSGVASEDLDLIVLCRERKLLSERAPIEVDLRSFDVGQVEQGIEDGQDLLTWAVRFGQPLFDPHHLWADIVEHWKDRLQLPDPVVARARASATLARLEDMRSVGDQDAVVELSVSYFTHLGRAVLAEAGTYPASRPELPDQLRHVGQNELADQLAEALSIRDGSRALGTAV